MLTTLAKCRYVAEMGVDSVDEKCKALESWNSIFWLADDFSLVGYLPAYDYLTVHISATFSNWLLSFGPWSCFSERRLFVYAPVCLSGYPSATSRGGEVVAEEARCSSVCTCKDELRSKSVSSPICLGLESFFEDSVHYWFRTCYTCIPIVATLPYLCTFSFSFQFLVLRGIIECSEN